MLKNYLKSTILHLFTIEVNFFPVDIKNNNQDNKIKGETKYVFKKLF